jgi:putative effector of murein hydrolase LrgA (UPF0299 family)
MSDKRKAIGLKRHPENPPETRYHVYRLMIAGSVAGITLLWLVLLLASPQYDWVGAGSPTLLNYRLLRLGSLFTGPLIIAIFSAGMMLLIGVLTKRNPNRALLIAAPCLAFGWAVCIFSNDGMYYIAFMLLMMGATVVTTIYRLFIRRHYLMTWDIGVGLITLATMLAAAWMGIYLVFSFSVTRHFDTVELDGDTYHLAQTSMFVFGPDTGPDTGERRTLFRCDRRYRQCRIVQMERFYAPSQASLTVENGQIVTYYGEGSTYAYDPNEQ